MLWMDEFISLSVNEGIMMLWMIGGTAMGGTMGGTMGG